MKKIILLSIVFFSFIFIGVSETVIAVLPYKIGYEGRIPKIFSSELIESSTKSEGKSYQLSMINYLVKMNSKNKNKKLNAKVLSQGQTEALMLQKNISTKQLDTLTNSQLAEILGINHVVRGSATRTFIMSDEMSLGITAVIVITGGQAPLINSTSNISIINSLENITESNVVFSKQFNRVTSATRSDEENLRDTFRYSARKMFKTLRKK
ncbi:MAG: hypothetical protein HQ463_05760 [Bacteroidetes bacterium]|nr:hypothetical protein [Bacteroidota bacterium]